jgi:indoleamine 2,3-dioxygenase
MANTLKDFGISKKTGFLPEEPPLKRLSQEFSAWDEVGSTLPKLLVSDRPRKILASLPLLDATSLESQAEKERAMVLLSFIGHAYVWGEKKPAELLPKNIAIPWAQLAEELGRPPVLSYASYALHNWQLLESDRGPVVGNIALLQNFWGGADEEWFILIHVAIEQAAAPAIASCFELAKALEAEEEDKYLEFLGAIKNSMAEAISILEQMTELCDPYCYFHRVRPFIHGWKNHPVLKKGLIYEGVERFAGKPQEFRGETGAQSSIIPALDGILKIKHENDPLREYLLEMKDYMPPAHRLFVETLEKSTDIRKKLSSLKNSKPELIEAYNAVVILVQKFRGLHLEYAASYINKQAQSSESNPSAVGTGGTPFMKYLKKHRDETSKHLL